MDEYRNAIRQQILSLSREKKIIFSLLTSERLQLNYDSFSVKYHFGEPLQLKKITSLLYEDLLNGYDNETIHEYISTIDRITPDIENYDNVTVSFALDACTSLLSVLYYI